MYHITKKQLCACSLLLAVLLTQAAIVRTASALDVVISKIA